MVNLSGGCRHSELAIYPSDFKSNPASITLDWYIKYRFYDPAYTQPKQVILKKGINVHTSWLKRVAAVRSLKLEEERRLRDGYNPYHDQVQPTDFLVALEQARLQIQVVHNTRLDIKSMLKYFGEAAQRIKLNKMRIDAVQRKHIKLILQECYKNPRFSHNTYNHYRKYLNVLFNYLCDEVEMIDTNPIVKLSKKDVEIVPRKVLSVEQRKKVKALLRRKKYQSFGRFLRIFFTSGSRACELLRVRRSDVNLSKQIFKVTIRKGKKSRIEEKVITDPVLPLWQQLMDEAKPNDYIFSVDLRPGPKPIRAEQPSRRWRKHIKGKLGIDVDFYALKALYTDKVSEKMGLKLASAHNSHKTTAVTEKHYAVGEKLRRQKVMKKVDIQL